jgi:hypothetical protein
MKSPGIVSGHDLYNPAFDGVFEALALEEEAKEVHYSFDFTYWWSV